MVMDLGANFDVEMGNVGLVKNEGPTLDCEEFEMIGHACPL
jgi:hypothetical protein